MPTHNLNHAQAYLVAIAPFLFGSVALTLLAVLAWAVAQTLAEEGR